MPLCCENAEHGGRLICSCGHGREDARTHGTGKRKRSVTEDARSISEVYALLERLGLTESYMGYHQTAYAIHLAVQRPERLSCMLQRLYPYVAAHFQTDWRCVERNIRTAIDVVWRSNRALLEKLAQRALHRKPSVAQFLSFLSLHLILDAEP